MILQCFADSLSPTAFLIYVFAIKIFIIWRHKHEHNWNNLEMSDWIWYNTYNSVFLFQGLDRKTKPSSR